MAQIKSQIKRNLTNEKARQRNAAIKSEYRTQIKKVRVSAAKGDKATATIELNKAYALLDKAVSKGVIKANTAARKKAEIQKLVNSIA